MKSVKFLMLSLFLCVGYGFNALAYSVKGFVTEPGSDDPESYATVRVYAEGDSVKAVGFALTDDSGAFDIALPKVGAYNLSVTAIGRNELREPFTVSSSAPVADLGRLALTDNSTLLNEVSVVASRPLVTKEIDRLGYDVNADEDAKTASVQDILRKVPMVTVEADGTIKVRGSSNFKIYKNGRPNNAFSNNAKDIFAAIPASMIKKIEVITDPGAREDAEGVGAILNIVTNENSSVGGVMGNIGLRYNVRNTVPNPNLWLTGNVGRFAISAYGGYFRQSEKSGKNSTLSDFVYANTGNRQISESTSTSKGNVGYWGIDASYDVDSLNLITLEFGGFGYSGSSHGNSTMASFDTAGNRLFSYATETETPKGSYLNFNGNVNYQHSTRRPGETLTFSYQISHTKNNSEASNRYVDTYNFPAPYTGSSLTGRSRMLEQTLQIDWTRPINEHNKFSVGGKLILRNNHATNDNEYEGWQTVHSDFKHLTTVGAVYADYMYSWGALNARAGVRYEYSRLSAKFLDGSTPDFGSSLNDWVPNASVMYTLSPSSTIKLAYSTRINRPGIDFLNPAINYTPTSQSSGNPDLESVHYNTVSLNYSLIKQRYSLDATLSYDFANNTIANITTVDASDYSTSMMENAGRNRSLSLSIFGQVAITEKTSFMVNGEVTYNKVSIPTPYTENSHWGVSVFARATQHLPWKLRLEGFLFFGTGNLSGLYAHEYGTGRSMFHGFSLQRSFLKDDALTAKIEIINPFNTKGFKNCTIYDRGDYTGRSYMTFKGPGVVGISLSYRFGKVTKTVKKTQATISNTDLQGGSSAPSTDMDTPGGAGAM